MGDFTAGQAIEDGASRQGANARMDSPRALFFKEFLRRPAMIGSIIPTSRRTIDAMLAPVDWATVKLFVEYGPGVGTFCEPILERLAPDATLIAIDTNEVFVDYVARRFRDSRFVAVHGSAADVNEIIAAHGFDHADHVLSGLPFSTLPPGIGPQIAEATQRVLRPGGSFLVYQYSSAVLKLLNPLFDSIDHDVIWRNIPPCDLFWAHKSPETPADPGA